jgi:hypothetical protein
MRKIVITLFLLSLQCATAQNGLTVASRFGIGELDLAITARQRGMGSVSVPLLSLYDISRSNPASWSSIAAMRLQGELSFESVSVDAPSSYTAHDVQLKGFQFSIPLEDDLALRLVSGVLPYSRVSYAVKVSEQQPESQKQFTSLYEGTGGVTMFHLGSAFRPFTWLRFGFDYQYYFGTIDHYWNVDFTDENYFNSVQTRSTTHSGSSVNIGLIFQPMDEFTFGVSFRTKATLRASQNVTVTYSSGDSSLAGASGIQDLPQTIRFGVGYRPFNNLLVAADYQNEDWSQAVIFDAVPKELGASNKLGIGLEWQPSSDERSASVLEKTFWRLGFYSSTSYLHLGSQSQKEYVVSVGAGAAIFGQNRTDLALEYGWHDAVGATLGKRSMLRLSVSVNIGEAWFVRRATD